MLYLFNRTDWGRAKLVPVQIFFTGGGQSGVEFKRVMPYLVNWMFQVSPKR